MSHLYIYSSSVLIIVLRRIIYTTNIHQQDHKRFLLPFVYILYFSWCFRFILRFTWLFRLWLLKRDKEEKSNSVVCCVHPVIVCCAVLLSCISEYKMQFAAFVRITNRYRCVQTKKQSVAFRLANRWRSRQVYMIHYTYAWSISSSSVYYM